MALVSTSKVIWKPAVRIIPSRFPPIQLFERVADPADLEAVFAVEAMTNPRLRDEVGDIRLVPSQDRISGPGSSAIMAAFTHLNPDGSRFTDGTYGVFYAGMTQETAIAETVYHREIFLRSMAAPHTQVDMRVYTVDLDADLHDIRGRQTELVAEYGPENYAAGQSLAAELRQSDSYGIVYDSVRDSGGECAAVFRPPVLSNCRQERHLCYVWNGTRIETVYEKRALYRRDGSNDT